jgi:integrase
MTIRAEFAKNGKARVLPLGDAMTATLRTLQATATSALVFPAAHGGLQHHFSKQYIKAVRAAKLVGVTIHCLRHSWATRMVAAGCDLVLLMHLGGWHSLSMVARYAHPTDRDAQAVAAMLADRAGALSPTTPPLRMTARPRSS